MNHAEYATLKSVAKSSIARDEKDEDKRIITYVEHDRLTGVPSPREAIGSITTLKAQIADAEAQLAMMKDMLSDLEAVK